MCAMIYFFDITYSMMEEGLYVFKSKKKQAKYVALHFVKLKICEILKFILRARED